MEVRSDRRWRFDADPPTLWAVVSDVDSYRSWWPWLVHFDAADGFGAGEHWSCTVRPPLPYVLRFTLDLVDVDPPRCAVVTVGGDITGSARLTVTGSDAGSEVRLESALAPSNRFLKGVARVAAPIVRFGHDWVLDTGASQFRRKGFPDGQDGQP